MDKFRILHTADIQVRSREVDLAAQYEQVLLEIESTLIDMNIEVYLIAGDLAEYAASNDAEKKVIYAHISRALAIPTLVEVVIMNGNHDLHDMRKTLESNKGNNAIDTFNTFVQSLEPELAKKVIYLKDQRVYKSKINDFSWVSYSLEDGTSAGSNLDLSKVPTEGFSISVYHDILQEYAIQAGLPVKPERLAKLASVENFATPLVLAGDIHENWETWNAAKTTRFIYPGSPIQRNHSEGSYFRIRKSFKEQLAAEKVVKLITVSEDATYVVDDIPLTNWISYVTIDLTTSTVVPDFFRQLSEVLALPQIWGMSRTFIKFKLSTTYGPHELEMIKTAQDAGAVRPGKVTIDTLYDKFVIADNTAVAIENGEQTDGDDDDAEITMDDLILTPEKLAALFRQVLNAKRDDIKKEFADEGEIKSIMNEIMILFNEQIMLAQNSTPNYSIDLDYIECNCFMALGKNKIELNIPGLTRITGTNGIGKTTLYNMLRWVIKDEIMENMPKNSKVKNALHLFNDNLPEIDTVLSRLVFRANGTKVMVSRWATRVWKQNTSTEAKMSKEWKVYVSGVNQGLKLEVFKNGELSAEKQGDEAQRLLDKWFGKVPQTIMILNQAKILSMLNMPSNELTQLVLDYIGVDFLNALENQLDMVKDSYDLAKPKVAKDKLKDELLVTRERVKIVRQKILDFTEKFNERKDVLAAELIEGRRLNDKLVKSGNIPALLLEHETSATEIETDITTFKTKETKEEPKFEIAEPKEPDTKETDKAAIEKIAEDIAGNNGSIEDCKGQIDIIWQAIESDLEATIFEERKAIGHIFDGILETKNTELSENSKLSYTAFASYIAKVKEKHEDLKIKETEAFEKLDQEKTAKKVRDDRIAEINKQLDDGKCSECGKPLVDDPEHWKDLEISLKTELDSLSGKMFDVDNLTKRHTTIKQFVTNYAILAASENVTSENPNYNDEIKELAKEVVRLRDIVAEIEKFIGVIKDKKMPANISAFSAEVADHNKKLKHIEIAANILDCAKRKNLELAESADSEKEHKANLDAIRKCIEDSEKYSKENAVLLEQVNVILKAATDAQSLYVKELQQYQNDIKSWQNEVNEIREHNKGVSEHNQKIDFLRKDLETARANVDKYKALLPTYIKLEDDYKAFDLRITELEAGHKADLLTEQKNSTDLERLEKEEAECDKRIEEYIAWQRKNLIFNIYQKLVKRDFRDIVFNYYRGFLNSTLNNLLDEMNFKLYWDTTGDLYMVQLKNGHAVYRPVQLVSGMETAFQGLSLIYSIHLLNIKNSISTLFIDELSGQLNSGKELSKKEDIKNYQEMFITLLNKFTKKNIFIIDHNIENLYETVTLQVVPSDKGSIYVEV
jgi:energy-coupling factor transporter ATP-binding protein EcfA2